MIGWIEYFRWSLTCSSVKMARKHLYFLEQVLILIITRDRKMPEAPNLNARHMES